MNPPLEVVRARSRVLKASAPTCKLGFLAKLSLFASGEGRILSDPMRRTSFTAAPALIAFAFVFCGLVVARPAYAQPAETKQGAKISAEREADDSSQEPAAGAPKSFLEWMAKASGPIGIVILLLSFYLIALVGWMFLEYRRAVAIPDLLTRELAELLAQKRFNDAFQRLAGDRSFLSRAVAAGARKLDRGRDEAIRAIELVVDDVTMEMEHRSTYLATVGTLGPMIGLVGTVYGMIMSFREMAVEGVSPQASRLAEGISTALFATLEGIAISIPAIYFHAFFRNRIARLSLEVAIVAEAMLDQFAVGSRPGRAAALISHAFQSTTRNSRPPIPPPPTLSVHVQSSNEDDSGDSDPPAIDGPRIDMSAAIDDLRIENGDDRRDDPNDDEGRNVPRDPANRVDTTIENGPANPGDSASESAENSAER